MPYSYPNLRAVLAPEYASLPDTHLDRVMQGTFGLGDAAEYEEFLGGVGRAFGHMAHHVGRFAANVGKGVGRVAADAGKVAVTVAPGMVQGAAAGSSLGPWGMVGGAVLGGGSTALKRYGRAPALRAAGSLLGTGVQAAGALQGGGGLQTLVGAQNGTGIAALQALGGQGSSPMSAVQPLLGALGRPGTDPSGVAGSPAAGQIARLLGRPELQQALMAAMMSPIGRTAVPVSGQNVPVGSFLNLLGRLGEQAAAEFSAGAADANDEGADYLRDATGAFAYDPANADDRAAALLDLLDRSLPDPALRPRPVRSRVPKRPAPPAYMAEDEDDLLDQLELTEMGGDEDWLP